MSNKYYFISDIHLGFFERKEDKIREDLLLEFLNKIKSDCEVLFILGDLFDYWFEYKTVIPKYFYRTLALLKEFSDSKIRIEYIIGNHDFGHKNFFQEELGINLHNDDYECILENKKFYLSHGDAKSNNDLGYRIIKKIMRNRFSLFIWRYLHPDFGISLAMSSSKKSRNYTSKKNFGEDCGMTEFAKRKISEGFDYVIMGHRHRIEFKEFDFGIYINLGTWIRNDTPVACFDGEKIEILKVTDFLSN